MTHIIEDVLIANILKTGITEIKVIQFISMYYFFVYANSVYKKSIDFVVFS